MVQACVEELIKYIISEVFEEEDETEDAEILASEKAALQYIVVTEMMDEYPEIIKCKKDDGTLDFIRMAIKLYCQSQCGSEEEFQADLNKVKEEMKYE